MVPALQTFRRVSIDGSDELPFVDDAGACWTETYRAFSPLETAPYLNCLCREEVPMDTPTASTTIDGDYRYRPCVTGNVLSVGPDLGKAYLVDSKDLRVLQ